MQLGFVTQEFLTSLKNEKLKSWEAKSSEVNQKTEVIILEKRECQTD